MAKRSVFAKYPEACKRIVTRTNALKVGGIYFLSSFYDRDGAMVKVVSKSTEINSAGWPSKVIVESIEPITETENEFQKRFYAPGTLHSVNATNLYEERGMANHKVKYSKVTR